MPDDPYTIADLARLAGVTPRTVRFYVAQGLLPSPEQAGPGTRYGEGHLARLRLIRRLQKEHLPLAEIRGRLGPLGDDDVERLLSVDDDPAADAPSPDRALAFVQDLMAQSGVQPRVAAERPALLSRAMYEPIFPDAFPAPAPAPASMPAPSMPVPSAPTPSPAMPPAIPAMAPGEPRGPVVDRSTWERHALTPDVELHVRRPLDRRANKRVEQLLRIARELFDEEP